MHLVKYPNKVLTTPASNLTYFPHAVHYWEDVLGKMRELMQRFQGIGLAAPQVGIPHRYFIADAQYGLPDVAIDPYLIDISNTTWVFPEGCLSLPGVTIDVTRPTSIAVGWHTLSGTKVEERLTGMTARVFLHELDHLDGILIIDK